MAQSLESFSELIGWMELSSANITTRARARSQIGRSQRIGRRLLEYASRLILAIDKVFDLEQSGPKQQDVHWRREAQGDWEEQLHRRLVAAFFSTLTMGFANTVAEIS